MTNGQARVSERTARDDASWDGWPVGGGSLSAPLGEDGDAPLEDRPAKAAAPSPEERLLQEILSSETRGILSELSPREARIIQKRFGLDGGEPKTLREIAEQLHLTRQRVQQIERRALEKLRQSRRAQVLRAFLN